MGMLRLLGKLWQHRHDEMMLKYVAVGMNSGVGGDRHIVMLDYDVPDLKTVVQSVEELQRFWRLSDAHVFKTRKGFHVFFWYDQVPYGRLKMIIEYARDVDPMYKFISRFYDHKTIRVQGKYPERDIMFVGIVPGKRKLDKVERDVGEMKRREHLLLVDPENSAWKKE